MFELNEKHIQMNWSYINEKYDNLQNIIYENQQDKKLIF